MWTILLWIAAILVGLLLLLILVGLLTPRTHMASSSIELRAARGEVWRSISDWRRFPEWIDFVHEVEELRLPDGRTGFTEHTRMGPMPLVITTSEPEQRLVTEIADARLPFGGTWTWQLAARGDGGTTVTLTEDGCVRPPLFRALSRFVFGHHGMMDRFLRALARKHGERAEPRHG